MSLRKLGCGHMQEGEYVRRISLKSTGVKNMCEECTPPMFTVCATCYAVHKKAGRTEEESSCLKMN